MSMAGADSKNGMTPQFNTTVGCFEGVVEDVPCDEDEDGEEPAKK